jgi:hypothetical protein
VSETLELRKRYELPREEGLYVRFGSHGSCASVTLLSSANGET